jgi:hypothetical protein
MQPDNVRLSAERRVKLLAGFDALDEDTRADIIELVEQIAHSHNRYPWQTEWECRQVIRTVYRLADLED